MKVNAVDIDLPQLHQADLQDQRVLCRVDFNVPLIGREVADDSRIRAALPTISTILEQHPRALVLLSHLGRPKGKRSEDLSLAPIAPLLSKWINQEVHFSEDCIGTEVEQAIDQSPHGSVWLLENTRFHEGETQNDAPFAAQLARLGDVFVNDAFGTCHRAHASNVGLSNLLPAYVGQLVTKEVFYLSSALRHPQRPYLAILGGAKISDKITILERLLDRADRVLIGGGMANTFLAAQGQDLGDSLVEPAAFPLARKLLAQAAGRMWLPLDATIAPPDGITADIQHVTIGEALPAGWRIMDIGPATVQRFTAELEGAQTIIWNGPLGVTENPQFAIGSYALAQAIAAQTSKGATTIIGGGDSAATIQAAGYAEQVSHLSTGGGASLALLAGEALPALSALTKEVTPS